MSNTQSLADFAVSLRDFISRSMLHGSVEEEFNHLALALFAAQFECNDAYRKFCLARKATPSRVAGWSEMPALPTTAFREFEVTCMPADCRATFFQSSGTTGERASRHWHSAESLAVYEASLVPWFQGHFLDPVRSGFRRKAADVPTLFISLTPPPQVAPHSSLVYMFAAIHREFGGGDAAFAGDVDAQGAWCVDSGKCREMLESAAKSNRPVALLGTAFNFVQLFDGFEKSSTKFRLPPGSGVLETGGYKGRTRELSKPELHALISENLGISGSQIVSEYGMCELSSQAYDGRVGRPGSPRMFQFPPWARAQIVSPETGRQVAAGETGLIRICDLANVWSVMAVQTGDLGVLGENGFELLGRAAMTESRGCSLMSL